MNIRIADLSSNLLFDKSTIDTINSDSDLRGFDDKKKKQEFIEFAKAVAYEYRRRVIEAVETQSLAKNWRALSPGYLAYKREHGLSTKIWKATGTLINSIVVTVTPSMIEVGVSYTAKEKNGESCRKIAKEMEYGTSKRPPRPLFGPIKRQLEKELGAFYLQWIFEKYGKPKLKESSEQALKNKAQKFNNNTNNNNNNNLNKNNINNKNNNMTGRKINNDGIPVEYISESRKLV